MQVSGWRLAVGGFVVAVAMMSLASPCPASGRKTVVVVANRVLLADIHKGLPRILDGGAPGLLSPNCLGPKNEYSVLLTAAAGGACRGGAFVADCFDANEIIPGGEVAGQAHFARTGKHAGRDSGVFLGVAQSARENQRFGSCSKIGALAEAVHAAGKRTCAIDNADMPPDVIDRSTAVLAANSSGLIDYGLLSSASKGQEVPDGDSYPSRLIVERTMDSLRRADLVVVNFGETTRLDETRNSISDKMFARRWQRALWDLRDLVGALMLRAREDGFSVVLVSFSPPAGGPWQYLTPIVVYPSPGKCILSSPSTRTPGLVAASDFAPTILKLMSIPAPPTFTGRAASTTSVEWKIAEMHALDHRVAARRVLEIPMLWTIALIGIIACTLSAVAVGFGVFRRAGKVARIGLLVAAASPLAMLLASLAPPGAASYAGASALAIICVVIVAWHWGDIARKASVVEGTIRPPAVPVVVVFWATAVCVLIDSAFGGTLCKFSLPSFFQISGLRFYGIGNEYAGALISMTALALLFSSKRFRGRALIPVGLVVTAFLGCGRLGANYGGTIAAVVTFGLLWTALRRGGFGARHMALWCAAGLLVSASFGFMDWKLGAGHGSHAGQAEVAARAVGGSYCMDVLGRKVLMNLRLTSSNTAEKVFLAALPFVALWFWKINSRVKQLLSQEPDRIAGLKALVIGAVVAYAANDSGVVMAGIMIGMTVAILLYSLVEDGGQPWAES